MANPRDDQERRQRGASEDRKEADQEWRAAPWGRRQIEHDDHPDGAVSFVDRNRHRVDTNNLIALPSELRFR